MPQYSGYCSLIWLMFRLGFSETLHDSAFNFKMDLSHKSEAMSFSLDISTNSRRTTPFSQSCCRNVCTTFEFIVSDSEVSFQSCSHPLSLSSSSFSCTSSFFCPMALVRSPRVLSRSERAMSPFRRRPLVMASG